MNLRALSHQIGTQRTLDLLLACDRTRARNASLINWRSPRRVQLGPNLEAPAGDALCQPTHDGSREFAECDRGAPSGFIPFHGAE